MRSDLATPDPAAPSDAPTPRQAPTSHFPGLEGLRAIAASAVVLTHGAAYAGAERAGWLAKPAAMGDIGVAVFFVLSGFLIYRPFARAHLQGRPPLRARSFWWRRVLRIVPAYWLALTFFWLTGFFSLGHDWWRYYLFLQIYDAFTTLSGIVPAWSLATEMTFYLMIPFWSGLVRRVVGRGRTTLGLELGGIGLLFASGYASRVVFSASHRYWVAPGFPHPQDRGVLMRQVAFSWLPNQIDLFAIGMAVAALWAWAEQRGRLEGLGSVLGRVAGAWWAAALATFVVIVYVLGPPAISSGYVGAYWQERQFLYGLVGVLLLLPLVFGDQTVGPVRRVLGSRPVHWVGVVSYGFYLWHDNLMGRYAEHLPGLARHLGIGQRWLGTGPGDLNLLAIMVVGFVGGLGGAAVSWYGMEKWLQRLKHAI